MFTGIVGQVGAISKVSVHEDSRSLTLSASGLGELSIGASIAVNGVCLTAVEVGDDWASVDVIPETLNKTNLGDLEKGSEVNLELPMSARGRFDGHIVQGHVDGVGTINEVRSDDAGTVITVAPPPELLQYIVEKGSVTVDGVSLTVAGMSDDTFDVALIPHTLDVTTLGLAKTGDTVNLEMDVLAKYVERLLETRK